MEKPQPVHQDEKYVGEKPKLMPGLLPKRKAEAPAPLQPGQRRMTARELRRARSQDRQVTRSKREKATAKRRMQQMTQLADAANIGRIYLGLTPARDTTYRAIVARVSKQVENIAATEGITRGAALERVEGAMRSTIELDNLRRQQEERARVDQEAGR